MGRRRSEEWVVVGWSVGWLVGWLPDRTLGWMVGWVRSCWAGWDVCIGWASNTTVTTLAQASKANRRPIVSREIPTERERDNRIDDALAVKFIQSL